MTPAQKKLHDLRIARARVHAELMDALRTQYDEPIAALVAQIAKDCNHPPEFVTEFQWEHDNGYGRQSKKRGWHCSICERDKHWEGSTIWSHPSERHDDD